MSERGSPIHYTAVEQGTPIYGSDDVLIGEVVKVYDNYREHILDGIVFTATSGEKRFIDGPEVQRTYENAVELNIDSAEAAKLEPPPHYHGGLGGLLGRFRHR